MSSLEGHVRLELLKAKTAEAAGNVTEAFSYLERAHILSQYSTRLHTLVHFEMLKWAVRRRDLKEGLGQLLRIGGSLTKTAIGFIPTGNTGGSNVSPFKPMPLPDDLRDIIEAK